MRERTPVVAGWGWAWPERDLSNFSEGLGTLCILTVAAFVCLHIFIAICWILHIKWVHFIFYKLWLNKVNLNEAVFVKYPAKCNCLLMALRANWWCYCLKGVSNRYYTLWQEQSPQEEESLFYPGKDSANEKPWTLFFCSLPTLQQANTWTMCPKMKHPQIMPRPSWTSLLG